MSREQFVERIRAALRGDASEPSRAPAEPPVLPAAQSFGDPVALFIDRARQLGVTVEIVSTIEDAAARAAVLCEERGVRQVAAWDTPDLAPVLSRLLAAGVEVLSPGAALEPLAAAGLGVTAAEWGIVETATLVLASSPSQPRLASLLPPLHLAILRAERLVPDLAALFARCGSLPSALTLITGPSRSADIGLKPVLGAHGPTAVTVFLIK